MIPLHIPPLRERREDILPIAESILRQLALDAALPEIAMDPQADRILKQYDWPENVRELSNVLERTVASLEGAVIFPRHLPFFCSGRSTHFLMAPLRPSSRFSQKPKSRRFVLP